MDSFEREVDQPKQSFLPKHRISLSFSDLIHEKTKTPSLFKIPETLTGKVKRLFQELLAEFSDQEFQVVPVKKSKNFWGIYWTRIFEELVKRGFLEPSGIQLDKLYNDEPKITMVRSFSPAPANTDGHILEKVVCTSSSPDLNTALSKVVGELLERIPLLIYKRENLLKVSVSDLKRSGKRFLDPAETPGFLDWQIERFPERRYSETSPLYWTNGKELISNTSALIPAQFVFWNYHIVKNEGEPFLREVNTNGAAGYFSYEDAVLGGIYELIQRDAFMMYWLYNQSPPRIGREGIKNAQLLEVLEMCDRYQLEVNFLYTTLDIDVPSCIVVLLDKHGGPAVAMGGGCDSDIEEAMFSALTEALGVHHWIREREALDFDLKKEPFTDPNIGQRERLSIWAAEKMLPRIKQFLSGDETDLRKIQKSVKFSSSKEELQHILGLFKKRGKGYEVYVYKAEHPALKAFNFHSIRAIVPKLIPLYLNENKANLSASRFREVAKQFGWDEAGFPNPLPHPFP